MQQAPSPMPPQGAPKPPTPPPAPAPSPQGAGQNLQGLPGLIHLIQALGGKAQGALGQGLQAAEKGQQTLDNKIGQGEDATKTAVLNAIQKLLGGAPKAPNPADSSIGNAALGGVEKALDPGGTPK